MDPLPSLITLFSDIETLKKENKTERKGRDDRIVSRAASFLAIRERERDTHTHTHSCTSYLWLEQVSSAY